MGYTSWGMWDPELQELISDIVNDTKITVTELQLRTAIFGTVKIDEQIMYKCVIDHCLDKAFEYNEQLPKQSFAESSSAESQLLAYKASLEQVLPALASALVRLEKQSEHKLSINALSKILSPHVEKFIKNTIAFSSSSLTLEYLTHLSVKNKTIKENIIRNLYGEDLPPDLLLGLFYNDPEVLAQTAAIIRPDINHNYPTEIRERMLMHTRFMDEVAFLRLANSYFQNKFESVTGKTMADYKSGIAEKRKKKNAPSAEVFTQVSVHQNEYVALIPKKRPSWLNFHSESEGKLDRVQNKESTCCTCSIS